MHGRLNASSAAYTQEQVDKIFTAAALAPNKARICPLAKLAVEETGMGSRRRQGYQKKFINETSECIQNAYRDTETCGAIEEG